MTLAARPAAAAAPAVRRSDAPGPPPMGSIVGVRDTANSACFLRLAPGTDCAVLGKRVPGGTASMKGS